MKRDEKVPKQGNYALREEEINGNFVDYVLYIDCVRWAVVEAKKEGIDLAGNEERDRTEALYKRGLHTKIGPLEDAVKACVAFGRISWGQAGQLGRELRFVTTRFERLQNHPFLGKLMNLCSYNADLTEAHMSYCSPEWNALVAYTIEKFPKLHEDYMKSVGAKSD